MAVKALAHQGHKQLAGSQLAAVGADRLRLEPDAGLVRGEGSGDGRTPELLQLAQVQGHHGEAGPSRTIPLPTRAAWASRAPEPSSRRSRS